MRVVVLGAGYAGVMAALRLSRVVADRHRVTLVNAESHFVERIRLHEAAAGRPPSPWPLCQLIAGTQVELLVGRVTAIEPAVQGVRVGATALHWDRLVLALGSEVDVDSVPGVAQHAFTLDGWRVAGLAAAAHALASEAGRVVVVGGGLSGIEAAAELAEVFLSLHVALVMRRRVGEALSARAQRHIATRLRAAGVELRQGVCVRAVEASTLVTAGGAMGFDLCVWAGGFRAPAVVAASGLQVNARGQVLVDARLRSRAHSGIYAAGDLAALEPAAGADLPMGCKTALPTGAQVARNVAAELGCGEARPLRVRTPFFCLSLGRRDGVMA